jgi:hypothetical protein
MAEPLLWTDVSPLTNGAVLLSEQKRQPAAPHLCPALPPGLAAELAGLLDRSGVR